MFSLRERQSATAKSASPEAPLTLDQPAARTLGLLDQFGMWANLGVSLLGFSGALFVLYPVDDKHPLSLIAAFVALLVGTLLGSGAVAIAAIPGAETGQPAMVVLRGLFGARPSWLPTVLNVVQLLGWTTFELVTISQAMRQITDVLPRWVWVLAGGVITTGLALRPLGFIRVLRRYVSVAVALALGYLIVELAGKPVPSWTHGTWHGFWIAVDTAIGVAVSWVPVAADYSRHSRTPRAAALGAFAGNAITQLACYAVGLLALVTVATSGTQHDMFGAFLALPVGTLAFAVLTVRELDQSFVDTYSTAVSMQNLRPRWDRRMLAVVIGTLATIGALALSISSYENFLILIGSVFVPLLGVLAVDYFAISRRQWDLSEQARPRWLMLAPWVLGFVAYQLVNPGYIHWWQHMWTHVDSRLNFTPPSWLSASLFAFAVAALTTLPFGSWERRSRAAASRSR